MAKNATAGIAHSLVDNKQVTYVELALLDFDAGNPRFGRTADAPRSQTEILDFIVNEFSVDDVLSSIAVNGFFVAEPLICREQDTGSRLTVVEGNRRLAACLILANDPRARNQSRKVEQFKRMREESGREPFSDVPVIRFGRHEKEKDLLSYLGVRHIAASQGWDSYAKAAWIARVVENRSLTLKEIALMTGDQHYTVRRLLEGYYFINQMIESGEFVPVNSARKGRGSNPEFPFSWVYTLLGYPKARQFVGLPDDPVKNPIPPSNLGNAATLMVAMYGDRGAGRQAAIDDSRRIGALAATLDDPEKVSLLIRGKSLDDIEYETQPIEAKLREGLTDCKVILGEIAAAIGATPPSEELAGAVLPLAIQIQKQAANIVRQLNQLQLGSLE